MSAFYCGYKSNYEKKDNGGYKNTIIAALSKLDQKDSFNIMTFNDESYLYSLALELATKKAIRQCK